MTYASIANMYLLWQSLYVLSNIKGFPLENAQKRKKRKENNGCPAVPPCFTGMKKLINFFFVSDTKGKMKKTRPS